MPGTLQPLDQKFAIVDSQGYPTLYFIQWAQQKQIDIGDSITLDQAQTLINDWAAARRIIAGRALDGGGFLSADVTIDHAESLVVPGTYGDATHVPQFVVDQEGHVQGVTAVAISGGGGTSWDFAPIPAANLTLLSGDATNLTLADDGDVGLLVSHGATTGSVIFRTAYRALTTKALDWTLVARIRRLHENRNFRGEGLIIMDSIGGKCISFELRNDQAGPCVFEYSNLTGTFVATLYSNPLGIGQDFQWQRIRHTGGNYLFDISADGKQWANVATVGDVAFLANRADRVGFMSLAMNAGGPAHMFSSPYWSLTGPGV